MSANVGQAGLNRWVPGAWKLVPDNYQTRNYAVRRQYTRELPGDRYMFDEVVDFAYQYTPENAVEQFGLKSQEEGAN